MKSEDAALRAFLIVKLKARGRFAFFRKNLF